MICLCVHAEAQLEHVLLKLWMQMCGRLARESLLPLESLHFALNEVPWKARRRQCLCCLSVCGGGGGVGGCKCTCSAPVFLPCRLLSRGPNWGPECPINAKPVRPFGAANMRRPHIMFSSQLVSLPQTPPSCPRNLPIQPPRGAPLSLRGSEG